MTGLPTWTAIVSAVSAAALVTAGCVIDPPVPSGRPVALPSAPTEDPSPRSDPDLLPSGDMPDAWLAWIAGSLPRGFSARATRGDTLGTTVVVAGDTRWLTLSRDADGRIVDRPDPPYAIPIDAFAVSPAAYAPFLPPSQRRAVTAALRSGRAVLGATSAQLRRLGPGGRLRFGGAEVRVGLVVPDEVVGWAEILVSREVGRHLGIVHDRYLLSMPERRMTERRTRRTLAPLLPGMDVEVVPPGGSEYMRIASGVNPPVVTKTLFGEFSAVRGPDPAFFTIDPAWVRRNIRTARVPMLGRVRCHRALLGPITTALRQIRREGLGSSIRIYSGCWAARTVGRSSTAPPSQHAYGAAIDINAPYSPYGSAPRFDRRAVAIFEANGFIWGGGFLIPDGHHFEWGLPTPPP